MEKITAKELSNLMSEITQREMEWFQFVDTVAYQVYEQGYATEDILDPEYMGHDYDYIFAQANNFWKTFKKKQF